MRKFLKYLCGFFKPQTNVSQSSLDHDIEKSENEKIGKPRKLTRILIRFRTAYIAPSSRVFGRGELVVELSEICLRYLKKDFWLDLLAAMPVPQVMIWAIVPNMREKWWITNRDLIRFLIIAQYLLRLYLTYPLSYQIIKVAGYVTEKAWAGAAYNLFLFMLASHVLGACWYLLAIERQEECWNSVCNSPNSGCHTAYVYCPAVDNSARAMWLKSTNISSLCNPVSGSFRYGIYADAVTSEVTSKSFSVKYFYCLWWGLRNLSTLGQGLLTSTNVGETCFAIAIAILGMVLFALLIGNMGRYLLSTTIRQEEWGIRRTDTEEWMRHRHLPHELKERIRRYNQERWIANRGVEEESILKGLPLDIRRDSKRHLCLELVRQVPIFNRMDETMLDVICEKLKPCIFTTGNCLVREGDPVNEMMFIIRGHLDSYTTDGGRAGFFNSCQIGPGDFCSEELLTWALDPRQNPVLPLSTRTVKAKTTVEAFSLVAEDLKFVASQFRRLNSKELRHVIRVHSHHWRTWAAMFIQHAWFRYMKIKEANELKRKESSLTFKQAGRGMEHKCASMPHSSSAFASYGVPRLSASTRILQSKPMISLQKPNDYAYDISCLPNNT
ncbi:hypothetical protein ACFE04_000397 [Oxalis oulophora]